MLALSNQLSFQIVCHKIKKELGKNQTKNEQKPNETEGDLHLVQ
jgi:hypothetical protein